VVELIAFPGSVRLVQECSEPPFSTIGIGVSEGNSMENVLIFQSSSFIMIIVDAKISFLRSPFFFRLLIPGCKCD
jgi:hypothetical protein